jgi:hypothetical protein
MFNYKNDIRPLSGILGLILFIGWILGITTQIFVYHFRPKSNVSTEIIPPACGCEPTIVDSECKLLYCTCRNHMMCAAMVCKDVSPNITCFKEEKEDGNLHQSQGNNKR